MASPTGKTHHQTDVLICGSGSAGLMAALWLSKYNVPFRILERRPGPLVTGQADGVQCRTLEILESFGLSDQVLRESYHATEVALWAPDGGDGDGGGTGGGIKRFHYFPDSAAGLSHLPHVILSQARVNGLITDAILRSGAGGREVDYGYEVTHVEVDGDEAGGAEAEYPVAVTAVKDGVEEIFRAKYALGCDGAHSAVRRSLGIKMQGDTTDATWGVMDVYPRTTFPDIRKKTVIRSPSSSSSSTGGTGGTLIIIPREGDSLVRFYIELPPTTTPTQVTLHDLQQRAGQIFRPYGMDIAATAWWSAYAIGQRLADRFHDGDSDSDDDDDDDDDGSPGRHSRHMHRHRHRVFLTGDACHTHSPKAGQGMNVSLQDGYNIGWKLGACLAGRAGAGLVGTYVGERRGVAAELIGFDKYWAGLFRSDSRGVVRQGGDGDGDGAAKSWADHVRDQFESSARYTAGQAYRYGRSVIVSPPPRPGGDQAIGPAVAAERQLVVGMRFPSAQVVRYSDAKVLQLLSLLKSDGRWRIVVFAGDVQQEAVRSSLGKVADGIDSIVRGFTPESEDPDSTLEPLLVLKTRRTGLELHQIPEVFKPVTGEYRIRSLHKVLVDDDTYESGHGHAFDRLGVDPDTVTVVVVRPDQYISMIVPGHKVESVGPFFRGFMTVQR